MDSPQQSAPLSWSSSPRSQKKGIKLPFGIFVARFDPIHYEMLKVVRSGSQSGDAEVDRVVRGRRLGPECLVIHVGL